MVLFGLYMVPRRYSRVSSSRFMFFMGVGTLAGAYVLGRTFGGNLDVSVELRMMAVVGGIIWGLGTLAYSMGVQKIGLSRSTPVKNTTAILGTLYGIVIFREFTLADPAGLAMAVAGSGLIVLAAILLGAVTSPGEEHIPIERNTFVAGVALSLTAALCYSFYAIPLKYAVQNGLSPTGFLYYMGQGAFLAMAALALVVRGSEPPPAGVGEVGLLPLAAGILWAAASAFCNSAIQLVGISIAWPVGNLNTVVAVAYGTWFLNEVRVAEHRRELYQGLLAATVGVALLALAMSR